MRAVGVRELKNRLSEFLRAVRAGEAILVTRRGEVVAELHQPGVVGPPGDLAPGIAALVREGALRPGKEGTAERYQEMSPLVPHLRSQELLDDERGER